MTRDGGSSFGIPVCSTIPKVYHIDINKKKKKKHDWSVKYLFHPNALTNLIATLIFHKAWKL